MFRLRRRSVRGAATGLAIALGFGGGVVTGVVGTKADSAGEDGVIAEAADEIADNAAHPVSREELEHAAIEGMLYTLDDRWAHYYTPRRYERFRFSLTGRYSGEGVSRAHERDSLATVDVSVRHLAGDVLVIDVSSFTRGVGRHVRQAVLAGPSRHSGGIVLDLRENPGGLLSEAVATASVFLDGGKVVSYEHRGSNGGDRRVFRARGEADTTTPLAVLVDGGSASAAEVVAGALQDRGRAVIVGSRTLGKGTVQRTYRLGDGSALKLTVGHYYTPSGRSIGDRGITPDVYVDPDRPSRAAMRRAQQVLAGLVAMVSGQAGQTVTREAGPRQTQGRGRG